MSARPPANASDAGPVIVCCAASEADEIREALAELEGLGHTLEIVEGIEDDPRLLADVIERLHGDGLYVLCRSAKLGRGTVEQLREILLAQHVPFGRTLTVATKRPRDLIDRVKASLARASTRRSRSETGLEAAKPKPRSTVSMAAADRKRPGRAEAGFDDEAITGVQPKVERRMPPGPPRNRRATIQNLAPPPVPNSAARERHSHKVTHDVDFDPPTEPLPPAEERRLAAKKEAAGPSGLPPPPPPPDSAAISMTHEVIDLHEHDPETSIMNASLDQLDFSDLDRAPMMLQSGRRLPADVLETPVGPVRTGNTSVAPAPRLPPEPEPLPSVPFGDAPETVVGPAPAPPTAAPPSPPQPPLPPKRSMPPAPPLAPVTPSSPSSGGAFPSAAVSTPAGAAASTTAEPDPPPRSKALWWIGGLAAAAVIAVTAAVVFSGDDEPDETKTAAATTDDDKTETSQGAAGDGKSKDADTPGEDGEGAGDGDEPATTRSDPGTTIVALADRKVRALDVLLVQPESSGPMNHADASTYCTNLDIAGLAGWRLPEVGELSSLTNAGMVGRSTYWSRTAGDTFGDSHFAWNARKRRAEQSSAEQRVLCVRDEQAG